MLSRGRRTTPAKLLPAILGLLLVPWGILAVGGPHSAHAQAPVPLPCPKPGPPLLCPMGVAEYGYSGNATNPSRYSYNLTDYRSWTNFSALSGITAISDQLNAVLVVGRYQYWVQNIIQIVFWKPITPFGIGLPFVAPRFGITAGNNVWNYSVYPGSMNPKDFSGDNLGRCMPFVHGITSYGNQKHYYCEADPIFKNQFLGPQFHILSQIDTGQVLEQTGTTTTTDAYLAFTYGVFFGNRYFSGGTYDMLLFPETTQTPLPYFEVKGSAETGSRNYVDVENVLAGICCAGNSNVGSLSATMGLYDVPYSNSSMVGIWPNSVSFHGCTVSPYCATIPDPLASAGWAPVRHAWSAGVATAETIRNVGDTLSPSGCGVARTKCAVLTAGPPDAIVQLW